jgi:diacylglycerol kinase (ATP)
MKGAGDRDLTRLYDGAKASRTEGVALALVNPAASGGRAGKVFPGLLPALRAGFPELEVALTDSPEAAQRVIGEWRRTHPDSPLLVAGGDGTLHEAVNCAVRAGPVQLGVIPLGSGNDFSRNAGIPLDPRQAVERLRAVRPRPIDLGRVCVDANHQPVSRVFLNSCSLGISVRANALARLSSRRFRGRLRYGIAGLRAASHARLEHYLVECGERTLFEGKALNLTVANGASFGGGMRISPSSVLDDGSLELVVLRPMGRLRLIVALARLQRGTHIGLGELSVTSARDQLRITPACPSPLEADGEELETSGTLTIDVLPGAIALLN